MFYSTSSELGTANDAWSCVDPSALCGDDHVKDLETHTYVDEQSMVSTAPLPVRQTTWMNSCGLFEVFSGGANR
ncbi:unnamed protein product [Amaranthus hypochondriacus]